MGKVRDIPLSQAIELINGDRNKEYGEPYDNFSDIAAVASVLLKPKLKHGTQLSTKDVTMIMIAVKLCRMTTSPQKIDSWRDIAGYIGAGWEALNEERANDEHHAKKSERDTCAS